MARGLRPASFSLAALAGIISARLARRLAMLTLVMTIALAVSARSATAARPATLQQTAAIRATIGRYIPKCAHGAQGRLTFRGAYISNANPRFGEGEVDDNSHTCYAFAFFVKRASTQTNHWRVIGELPDSLVPCSSFRELPAAVRKDFRIVEARANGSVGQCRPPTGGRPPDTANQWGVEGESLPASI
jgi:hypothetical protein